MERFITNEEDFVESNKIISRLIKNINTSPNNNDTSRCWLELEAEINFATGSLGSLELEFNGMNALEKRTVHKQLLQHKQGLKQIKQSIDRMKLLEKEVTLKNSDLNTTMLSSVDNSTRSLESSRRLVAETEKIGGNIIVDLEHQRTALLGAKDNVKTTQSSTASARKMLRSISSRWRHTKIFLVFLNFLLMILIGMLIYYGWIKKGRIDESS